MDRLNDDDKIAIIGIGCRYGGGVSGPREIWDMLKEKRDCTSSHPPERFDKSTFFYPGDKKKGKLYTKTGGYLKQDPFMFDRQFFTMSPDEANHMDPQIRILLEVVWESIEDAGIPASTLRGSNTGFYMGVTANEYMALTGLPQSNIGQYTNSGTNSCMISNRISYEFDLRGPSFSIDTACSSSLYAVQIARDALRGGVCDTAIAGGVNIILTPSVTIGFCQAGMLSPDGQCRSFDESANGYSRSEGVGSVVLKPLKRAMADGDRIYAVIRGGALTNDGRTPGIANPSFDAQIDLVHRACAAAKVDPRDVAYIEAHGTGTPVGDKTEANAIGEAMSKQRSDDMPPLYIGSIKSNVGHAEGAAGIAGVIKTALSLYHREIPGVAHFQRGNPNINFKDLKLSVPAKCMPWPTGSKLLAGCSSFGFGGANAHVVFEAAPSLKNAIQSNNDTPPNSIESYCLLILTAQSLDALEKRIVDFKNFLSKLNSDELQNVLYTANMRTHKHVQRSFFIAKSMDELLRLLEKRISGERSDSVIEGKAPGQVVNRTVFVFSGMGTQWWGMARELMITQPVFRNIIEVIDENLRKNGARWSLIQMLSEETKKDRINNDTEISQTCICSVQIGLVELYRQYGVIPSAIIGHSVGEVAAAYAAGLITMTAAVKIIFKRGNLLRKTTGSGTMAAVLHNIDDVQLRLKSTTRYIDIAAINSPTQIVLSGNTESINQFTTELKEDGIQSRVLKVKNAFHSRQQEILKEEFIKKTRFLNKNKYSFEQRPLIPMMSTVNNRYLTIQEANSPDYWWSNVRRQVRFKDGVESLLKDGYNSFLEIGAHPALSPAIKDIIASTQNSPAVHFISHSLKRPRDLSSPANDVLNFSISLAQMCVNGYPIDLKPFYKDYKYEVASLPLYPWQRIKCSATTEIADIDMRYPNAFHPLLGEPETSANYSENRLRVWKANIGTNKEPWISDHVLQGSVVFPAAGFIETAIAAHNQLFTDAHHVFITDLHFDRFLFISEDGTQVETTTEMTSEGTAKFIFQSLNIQQNKWTKHSTMNLNLDAEDHDMTDHLTLSEIMNRCPKEMDKDSFYSNKKEIGFYLGKSFTCIESVNYSSMVDEALLCIHSPDTVAAQSSRFYIHPAFLDAILQGMAGLDRHRDKTLNPSKRPVSRVPRSIESVYFKKCTFPDTAYLHFTLSYGKDVYADVYVADTKTLEIIGKFTKLRFGSVGSRSENIKLNLWDRKWVPVEMGQKSFDTTGLTLITGGDEELSYQLNSTLASMGLQSKIERCMKSDQLSTIKNEQLSNVIIAIRASNKENNSYQPTKEDFLEQQSHIAKICIDQYQALSSMANTNPNVWIVTRDGFSVNNKVDPNQSSVYGFALCVMQEDLNFKLSIIDLPSDIGVLTAADWLFKYIWGSDNDENVIALRHRSPHSTNDGFSVYSSRICVNESHYFPHKQLSNKWKLKVDQTITTGRLSLIEHNSTEEDKNKSVQLTAVGIESFQLLNVSTETSSDEIHRYALFCAHSGPNTVMGVCSSKELKSSMLCKSNELIKIESKLHTTQIINIVTSYFIPFMAVRDLKPDDTTVVCMSSNNDKQGLAVAHMALELGHRVVMTIKHRPTEYVPVVHEILLKAYESVNIVDGNDIIKFLDEQSVGCVIGCAKYVSELLKRDGMKRKLKPFPTIEILNSKTDGYRTDMFDLPVNAKVVFKNYELPLLNGFQELKYHINTLLRLFETQPSLLSVQDINSQNVCLTEIKDNENIHFSDVTFAVGKEAVPVNYDFFESKIKFEVHNSYIVTGGTNGFGLCLVEWLANNGAGHIVILSRSVPNTKAQRRLDRLKKCGTEVVHIKTDITRRVDVERAFETVVSDFNKPLSGVFHCAAQYDDRLIKDTKLENWKNVMAVKSWGAFLLHETTVKRNMPLKYFVMVSSVVQFTGNAGQASYCAANNYLSSLGHVRRSKGLPATVFCPGVIGDTGFAARKGLVDFWERKGIDSLTAAQVLNGLSVALLTGVSEIGISGEFRINNYIKEHRGLIKDVTPDDESGLIKLGLSSARSFEEGSNIINQKPDEAKLFIFQTLCTFIAKRVGITGEISPDSSPSSLGIDSLMSTELTGDIQRKFSIPFSPIELINGNVTIHTLSVLIYKRITAKGKFGGQENRKDDDTENEEDTAWKAWYIMDETVISPDVQLVCFPPNGGGPSVYAWWQNRLSKHNVQLIMAKLPGWEGRHLEKPLQNLEEIVTNLTDYLIPRLLPGRFVLFGHSMGGLIAFEVAHILKRMNLEPAHIIISSWYAPTLDYPHGVELENAPNILRQMELNIKNNIRLTDNTALRLSFINDDVLANTDLMKRLIPCFQVGLKICRMYRNIQKTKLRCGMTVFGAKSDRFIPTTLLDGWRLEIEPHQHFRKVLLPGGHMHITSAKKAFFREIQTALKGAFSS